MFSPSNSASSSSKNTVSSNHLQEIKIGTCQYQNRPCYQSVIDSHSYCINHILEDKSAPYRQCSYTYPNTNKRCTNAAPKNDKRDVNYCQMHLWKMLLKRQKSNAKNVPPMTTESLLSELSHYVRPVRNSWTKNDLHEKQDPKVTNALNPFVEVDVSKASLRRVQVLECASESDSDNETATLDNVWRGCNEESSDAESVDSQVDDPLKRAGIYTAEEVVMLTRNKMMRLQMLYQRQFDKLTHTLKEKRRNYLQALKKEKETAGPIYSQNRTTAKEHKMYEKLKALTRYHKRSHRETIAYLLSAEKRARQAGTVKPPGAKCSYTEGGVRCSVPILPLTKFCFKHILQDPGQCIFRACGCVKADTFCQEPVFDLGPEESCVLHLKLPTLPHVSLPESVKCEYVDVEKSMDVESELDASATESAVSTDNRDSPDDVTTIEEPNTNNVDSNQLIFFSPDGKSSIKEETVIEEAVIEEVVVTDS